LFVCGVTEDIVFCFPVTATDIDFDVFIS